MTSTDLLVSDHTNFIVSGLMLRKLGVGNLHMARAILVLPPSFRNTFEIDNNSLPATCQRLQRLFDATSPAFRTLKALAALYSAKRCCLCMCERAEWA